MDWYIFGEAERGSPAPAFRLQAANGAWVARDDYRQMENLVLFFPHSVGCPGCLEALRSFAQHYVDYRAESARVLAILVAPVTALAALGRELGNKVTLLADPDGKVRGMYAELTAEDDAQRDMLFLLDRFGAPIVALASGRPDDPAIHAELMDWLTYSEIKCPE